jgi:hypothetical protein
MDEAVAALRDAAGDHLRRVYTEALAPGVTRLHVDPSPEGLRLRVRHCDRRLIELAPVPEELAPAVMGSLRRGTPLPRGFRIREERRERGRPEPARADPVQRRIERWAAGEARALRVQVTPVQRGLTYSFCLTPLSEAPEDTALDPQGHLRERGALRERIEAELEAPGGLVVAMGLSPLDAHDATVELLHLADPEREQVTYQVGPSDLPVAPGAIPVHGEDSLGWNYRAQVSWAMKLGPDRLVAACGASCEAIHEVSRAALGGTQVLAAASMRRAGLELALWTRTRWASEALRVALRGVWHAASLPRLCSECRRPSGDGPVPAMQRGTRSYRREGCVRCRGTGVRGRVHLRAWTPADAGLLHALDPEGDLPLRAAGLQEVTAEAHRDLLDQLGVALREGWVEAESAARIRRQLAVAT